MNTKLENNIIVELVRRISKEFIIEFAKHPCHLFYRLANSQPIIWFGLDGNDNVVSVEIVHNKQMILNSDKKEIIDVVYNAIKNRLLELEKLSKESAIESFLKGE